MKRICAIIFTLIPLTACATSLPEERRDYILSKPHGWMNLTITDSNIPQIKGKDEDGNDILVKPYSCDVSVKVNSELYMSLSVYPDGQAPPYSVQSGFRLPLPTGDHFIDLRYTGCRTTPSGERGYIETSMELSVHENRVTEMVFGNDVFTYAGEQENDEVTLRQIMDAIRE